MDATGTSGRVNDRYLPTTRDGCLARLMEEIGEVMIAGGTILQLLGKIERHGWQSRDRFTEIEYDNQKMFVEMLLPLSRELLDAQHAIEAVIPYLVNVADGTLIDQHPGSDQIA